MFNAIASRYDFLNRLLSGGMDRYWRRRAVRHLGQCHPSTVLDVASGTADLAIAAARLHPDRIVGIDIAEEMLKLGRTKVVRLRLQEMITLQTADAEHLPFPDRSFDAVTVAFGVRNFENLSAGLSEMHRVLRPGGRAVILEFSRPTAFPFRQLYLTYFRRILPVVGNAVSGHRHAYTYLPETALRFPEGESFLQLLRRVGFSGTRQERLTGGIVTIYTGSRN
jgi:demethylmenaquinone methyltransferase/2-methoxy-6-polyprenyl-1,4-benzoquinol methylase